MRYVLVHRAFPVPLVLSEIERDVVVDAQRGGSDGVTIDKITIPMEGIAIMPLDLFLKNDHERLSWKAKRRCRWGTVHDVEERGSHETCRDAARPDSPYLDDTALDALLHPKVELDACGTADAQESPDKVIASTEKMIEKGRAVFRTLVRKYREYPHLVSEKFTPMCEAMAGIPIDEVPLAMPSLSGAAAEDGATE